MQKELNKCRLRAGLMVLASNTSPADFFPGTALEGGP